jgi:hypothetical protein
VYDPSVAERPRIGLQRATGSYAIGTWKDLVVWVVDGHTPLDELKRLRSHVAEWTRERGGRKNVTLVVLHAARTTMSSEERASVARMIDETKRSRVASSTVVLADGLVGALHRSILTGFTIVVPPPHPTKVCADVATAIAFLHPHVESLCGRVAQEDLAAMVEALHEAILAERALPGGAPRAE